MRSAISRLILDTPQRLQVACCKGATAIKNCHQCGVTRNECGDSKYNPIYDVRRKATVCADREAVMTMPEGQERQALATQLGVVPDADAFCDPLRGLTTDPSIHAVPEKLHMDVRVSVSVSYAFSFKREHSHFQRRRSDMQLYLSS